ncbi:TRAP transporter large permease subunit [Staphylococcus epidermidis]|nr:TRAP transporter large permease subunit [Staphylococcus epidermidis]
MAAESILSFTDNVLLIWTILIVFLLFVGMFMETLAAIMILVPVLCPSCTCWALIPRMLASW